MEVYKVFDKVVDDKISAMAYNKSRAELYCCGETDSTIRVRSRGQESAAAVCCALPAYLLLSWSKGDAWRRFQIARNVTQLCPRRSHSLLQRTQTTC